MTDYRDNPEWQAARERLRDPGPGTAAERLLDRFEMIRVMHGIELQAEVTE